MENRIVKLEQTLMELGSETHRLRNEIELYMESNVKLQKQFHILKTVLDERGVIMREDFEVAEELAEQQNDFPLEDFNKKLADVKKVLQ